MGKRGHFMPLGDRHPHAGITDRPELLHEIKQVIAGLQLDQGKGPVGVDVPLRTALGLVLDGCRQPAQLLGGKD